VRRILGYLPANAESELPVQSTWTEPKADAAFFEGSLCRRTHARAFDIRSVLELSLRRWGSLPRDPAGVRPQCGDDPFARLAGQPVGVIANQPAVTSPERSTARRATMLESHFCRSATRTACP